MSYYDDSSLVMIPSGYKTSKVYSQKPTDGTGDLTFTRSNDTATRVASNGLIQKVRTNLLVQSNTFSTTWFATSASVTSGQAGYDGTNNAWLLSKSAANGNIAQSPASSGSETISIYAKAGTDNWLHILVRDSALVFFGGYFDLKNGVVGSAVGATTLKIESVGNGWYRCSASFVKSTTNFYRIYPAEGNNDTSGTSGNILIQSAQLEIGDIMTDYIATTTAAVSVGPVANVPRLDYLNSSCPRLLLEPQRTNSFQFSESFDNAYWTKQTCVVTANTTQTLDPSGYNGADFVVTNNGAASGVIQRIETITASQPLTLSVFLKYQGVPIASINCRDNATSANNAGVSFNIQTGVISTAATAAGTCSNASATITNYGNGWYRCTLTFTNSATTSFRLRWFNDGVGNGVNGTFAWGFQLEQNASYATSYISTLNSAVTRGADAAYKGSISSLIGATEGVLFVDFIKPPAAASRTKIARVSALLTAGGNSFVNSINLDLETNGNLRGNIVTGGVSQVDIQTASYAAGTRIKMAFAYKANDVVLYINGTQIGTDTSAIIPVCTAYEIASYETVNSSQTNYVSQALLFKTRLTNAQLAELTTL